MRNIFIEIEYDGSGFYGWQKQPDRRTVQGELETALTSLCGEEIILNGASRTDAGVHALGQAASFTGRFGIPADRIPSAVNSRFSDVRINFAKDMPEDFHARFDSVGKTYCYRVKHGSGDNIFLRNYCYQLNDTLNTVNMKEAGKYLTGTHDFNAFRSSHGAVVESTVRTIYGVSIVEGEICNALGETFEGISIRFTGSGFLYNMVRILTGTLVETGTGSRSPEEMLSILSSRDRRLAGHKAPASGLYLEKVYYNMNELERELNERR